MKGKPLNRSLSAAKTFKQDEFQTWLSDIENELWRYTERFKGKTVLCDCVDPRVSHFLHFFSQNFEKLRLKKLIATCDKNQDTDWFTPWHARGKTIATNCRMLARTRIAINRECRARRLKKPGRKMKRLPDTKPAAAEDGECLSLWRHRLARRADTRREWMTFLDARRACGDLKFVNDPSR